MLKFRKAVFIVVYHIDKNKIFYVILKRKKHWKGFEFPKGGVEKGEKLAEAAKREVKEETGLNVLKLKKFNLNGKYLYNQKVYDRPGISGQTYSLFSAEVIKRKIKVDKKEHYSGEWIEFEKAIEKLTWQDQRKALKIVDKWIKKQNK